MNRRSNEASPSDSVPTSDSPEGPEYSEPTAKDENEEREGEVFDASEYVRQLIARAQSNKSATPVASSSTPEKKQVRQAPSIAPVSSLASDPGLERCWLDDILSPTNDADPEKSRRARVAVAQSVDLKKLREFVNISATSALDDFDRKDLIGRAYIQLATALFCMAMSLVLLTMCEHVKSLAFGATVGMLVLAGTATFRFAVTTRFLATKTRPNQ